MSKYFVESTVGEPAAAGVEVEELGAEDGLVRAEALGSVLQLEQVQVTD